LSVSGSLFVSELVTLLRRWRTLAILGVLAMVPVLVAVAVRLSHRPPGRGGGPAFLGAITENGLFVGMTSLVVSLPLFLPLAIGVVAGDTIAGEANLGTLRYLLVAPAGRTRLLAVKLVAVLVFCVIAPLVVVLVGAGIGAALFPTGPVTLLSGDTVGVAEALGRELLVAGYVSLSLAGLAAVGLFISTLTEIPVGAMAATVTVCVVSEVLDQLPQVSWLWPYLFTDSWLGFGDLLRSPISFASLQTNLVLQLAYVVIFSSLAWARFTSRDILS
jgi:ABC-2 type transport system permease protein